MIDRLIELLKQVETVVKRQGSFTDTSQYPDSFFTFWNDDIPDHSKYDNKETSYTWSFTIYHYAIDPDINFKKIVEAKELLESNGWYVPGLGMDITSDSKNHSGRMIEAFYLQQREV